MILANPPLRESTQTLKDTTDLTILVHSAWRWREQKRAQDLVQQVLTVSTESSLRSRANIIQAYITWREGKLAQALELIQPCIITMRQEKEMLWLARALSVRSCIGLELGEFAQSVDRLEEQLRISRAVPDMEMEACAMHDLGVMHFERNPLKAEPFLERALELFEEAELVEGYAYAALNLAHVRSVQGNEDEVRVLLSEVLELAETHELSHVKPHVLGQQGRLELAEGHYETAQNLFLEALVYEDKVDSKTPLGEQVKVRPLAEIMPSLAACYRALDQYAELRDLLERHLAFVLKEGFLPFAVQAHELLTDVFEELDELSLALKHSREHMRLHREVYAKEHESKVRALEVLHRTQLVEHRVINEQQKNTELRIALSQLEQENQEFLEVSLKDQLTGLWNRRYLVDQLRHFLQGVAFSIAIIDLDHFKSINDTYGHEGGDWVLKEFASLLTENVREIDTVVRFGGEEFVVVFPATSLQKAKKVLERVLAAMKKHDWSSLKAFEHPTFTAGISDCKDLDLEASLKTADDLLYLGKRNGRNGIWLSQY